MFNKKAVNGSAVEIFSGVNAGVALDQLGKFATPLRYECVGATMRRPSMLSARWRSRVGDAAFFTLLLALAVWSLTLPHERTIRSFRIEFADAAFVVEEEWVAPNERAQNFTEYQVRVPRARVPVAVQALMSEREREVYEREAAPDQILNLDVKFRLSPKSGEQFRRLVEVEGWKPLPDTNPDFRIAAHDTTQPYTTPRMEAYEVKADPRYVIFCSVDYYGGDRTRPWKKCGVTVPYHTQCTAERCTQIRVAFAPSQMTRWAEIAEQVRGVIRPFEVTPDPENWQRRERMRRDAASWYQPSQPKAER